MKRLLARIWLKAFGFRVEGEWPDEPRTVMIAAPHTSNWDALHMIAMAWYLGMKIRWLGKDSLFRFPFRTMLRLLGGVPVDRSKKNNLVDQAAELIRASDHIVLAVPAEGTRKVMKYWKSGFYYIARAAEVPIVPTALDYAARIGTVGPTILPTDDMSAAMDPIRAVYAGKKGRVPARFTAPTLRAEDEASSEE